MRVGIGALGLISLVVVGCGDDSRAIHEQWPDFTAGASPNSSAGANTAADQSSSSGAGSSASPTTSTSSPPGQTSSSTPSSSSGSTSTSGGTGSAISCSPDRFRCVSAVPGGWEGPIARKEKAANGLVPACDGEYRFQVNARPYHAEPKFDPATCSSCACIQPNGVECSGLSALNYYKDSQCTPAQLLTTIATVQNGDRCTPVSGTSGARSVKLPVSTADATNASCTPRGGYVSKTAYSWERQERLCRSRSADQLSCGDSGQRCVPKVEAGFASGVCIYKAGDHSCPAGDYRNKVLLYMDSTDDRGCTACNCGVLSGTFKCGGLFMQFSNDSCSDGSGEVIETVALNADQERCARVDSFPSGGPGPLGLRLSLEVEGLDQASCPASGGAPTGAVRGADPLTLCCTAS